MAKDPKQEQKLAVNPDVAEITGPPKSYRLQIALGLVCLILFQILVLWLMLPSRAHVEADLGLRNGDLPNAFDDPRLVPPNLPTTVRLEEIPIREGRAITVTNLRNEAHEKFTVVIHVQVRRAEKSRFTRQYELRMNEILDRINAVLQATSAEERSEVGHTTIKNRLQRAINEILDTPWVQQVFLTDVDYTIQ